MTRPFGLVRLVPVLVGMFVCAQGAPPLLRNSGFEESDDTAVAGWRADKGGVAFVSAAHSGQAAVRLDPGCRVYQVFPIEAGFIYEAKVWARGPGLLHIGLYQYTGATGAGYSGSASSGALALTDTWCEYRLSYSKGAREEAFHSLALGLTADRKGAEVFIDDAVIEQTALPPPPANLLVNPDFSDADGDGLPEAWHGEKRRLRIESVGDGVTALRCDAALFSADYMPDDDFGDWWDWQRWGEQHGSGWPPLPRPLGGAYAAILESDPVPVAPGRRYDVQLLVRELDVWGQYCAVRWFGEDQKRLAEFEERLGYRNVYVGNCSDWRRYTGRTTSPQAARYAALVVGLKLSSGALWIARPSLSIGRGAPGLHTPRYELTAAPMAQGTPRSEPVAPAVHRPMPAEAPGVVVDEDGVHIVFGNGVALRLPLRDGRMVGVTEATCVGIAVRNPQAPPLAPLVETIPARRYTECLYRGWERQGETVVLYSVLRSSDGAEDLLHWRFRPERRKLAGRTYDGCCYSYWFSSVDVRVRRILDRATWEAGGTSLGQSIGREMLPITPSSSYCVDAAYRCVGADSFDFQTGAAGTIVGFAERLQTALLTRAATRDFVLLQDTFCFAEPLQAQTAFKHVLFAPGPSDHDHWAALRDELFARFRKQLGAPAERPLEPAAMILGWSRHKGIRDEHLDEQKPDRSEYFRWVTEKTLEPIAELGFKRVMITLGMAPWNWPAEDIDVLAPEYEDAFRALCDRAHALDMQVISWYGTGYTLDQAPVWSEHPQFVLRKPDGDRAGAYYSPWCWPGNLAAGYADHTLRELKTTRKRVGLDGLWLDSYASAHSMFDIAGFRDCVLQADAFLPWQAGIEKLGYITYCEGHPRCLGFPSGHWRPPQDLSRFRPELYYKHAFYFQQGIQTNTDFLADAERRHYYRFLANRCCPIIDMGQFGTAESTFELIARANHDFNAVSDLMQTRNLLGARGVEWLSRRRGRALFAFEPFEYSVPKRLRALRDVTSGERIPIPEARRVTLERYHTYRLTRR